MALKGQISLFILSVSILALELSLWFFPASPIPAGAIGARSVHFKPAPQAVKSVGTNAVLTGISIHDTGDFPVVQQPPGNTNYVSKNDGEVTQFASANQYGNVGLLAHNYLSGRSFSKIRIGEEIHLTYSDGSVENFIVTEILRYQALDPKSPYSSFQNMDDDSEILTVAQMFDRAYQGGRHLTIQTCIAAEGNSSWGRLFIIAVPDPRELGYEPASLVNFSSSMTGE